MDINKGTINIFKVSREKKDQDYEETSFSLVKVVDEGEEFLLLDFELKK